MLQTMNLPDWVPWWLPLVLIVPAALWGLVFIVMPFSVLALRHRLEDLEIRLDDIQNELRHNTARSPGGSATDDFAYHEVSTRLHSPYPDRLAMRRPNSPIRHGAFTVSSETAKTNSIVEDRVPLPPSARPVRRARSFRLDHLAQGGTRGRGGHPPDELSDYRPAARPSAIL